MWRLVQRTVAATLLVLVGSSCGTVRSSPASRRETTGAPAAAAPGLRAVRVNGTVLNYLDSTAASPDAHARPAVVLVHGSFGTLDNWREQIRAFAGERRIIAYSRRYHRPNAQVEDGQVYSAELHAADLAAFIRTLGVGPVDIVGGSYGGLVALEMTRRHPELVHALVLQEPPAMGLFAGTPMDDAMRRVADGSRASISALFEKGDFLGAVKATLRGLDPADSGQVWEALPSQLQQYFLSQAFSVARETAAPLSAWLPPLSCADLRPVRMPVLLIRGERTSALFHRTMDTLAGCLPAARAAVIPNAGHCSPCDNPAAFNTVMLEFLRSPSSGGQRREASRPDLSATQQPDLILLDGKVFTSDTTRPWAEAVAIRGDRIVAVGSSAEIRSLAGADTRLLELGGRVVVPGFNDAHDHVFGVSPGIFVPTGAGMRDPAAKDILDSLTLATARVPVGTWIRVEIWVRALNDPTLRRTALDSVAPNHPVLLGTPFGHRKIANSAALQSLGIGDAEPDPFGGWYERDGTGRLTGRLDEYAGYSAYRRLRSREAVSRHVASLRRHGERALRLGVTSVQFMTHSNTGPETTVRVFKDAQLPLRVRIIKGSIPTATSLNADEWDRVPLESTPLLVLSGRKWVLDGTPVEGNALRRATQPCGRGRLNFPVDSIRVMLAHALATGEQLALHIVGDSTAAVVLSLMEELAPDSAWRRHRLRFEHAGVPFDLWPRASSKGIVQVANLQLLPSPPLSRMLPKMLRDTIVSADMPIALGSDAFGARSPYVGMYYALSLPLEPPLSREDIVRQHTLGSAFAEFQENEKGRLAPGMLADMAVLSQDIFTIPLEELPRTESVLTLIGGKVVWNGQVIPGITRLSGARLGVP